MRALLVALFATASITVAQAAETCRTYESVDTSFGELVNHSCRDDKKKYVHTVSVAEQVVLRDDYLSIGDSNKARSIWIFRGAGDAVTGCAQRLYLVDLSAQPVRVIAFGVKTACTEFHWASWGKSRSVIALKRNVRFVYENGRLTPPRAGNQLFESVAPPQSSIGGGMSEESAVPFVEGVPLPK